VFTTNAETATWAIFVVAAVERNWLPLVTTLDLSFIGRFIELSEPALKIVVRLLVGCIECRFLRLRVTKKNTQSFWPFLARLPQLVCLELTIPWKAAALDLGDWPANLSYIDLQLIDRPAYSPPRLEDFWSGIDALEQLEMLFIHGMPDSSFVTFPNVLSKLDMLNVRGGKIPDPMALRDIFRAQDFHPSRLTLAWRDLRYPEVHRALCRIPYIELLRIEAMSTLALLRGLPSVGELELAAPYPTLFTPITKDFRDLQLPDPDTREGRCEFLRATLDDSVRGEIVIIDYPPILAVEVPAGCYDETEAELWRSVARRMELPDVLAVGREFEKKSKTVRRKFYEG
jgi:hypothetical protein